MATIKYAAVRTPAQSIVDGLSIDQSAKNPDYRAAIAQHQEYCPALQDMGYTLIVLPPDDAHPDSVFTEDPVVILNDLLIKARLQDPSRRGEEDALFNALTRTRYFPEEKRFAINAPGTLEGGDTIFTGDRLFVGITRRTNILGARQLGKIARDVFGVPLSLIPLPDTVLHLKSIASFVRNADGEGYILAEARFAGLFERAGYPVIPTPGTRRFDSNVVMSPD